MSALLVSILFLLQFPTKATKKEALIVLDANFEINISFKKKVKNQNEYISNKSSKLAWKQRIFPINFSFHIVSFLIWIEI
jgi:hypothetical protein